MVVDESRNTARHGIKKIRRLLRGYANKIGKLRLLVRGVDPAISEPLAIETVDVSTPESLAAMLLGMLPFFIVMAIFMGGYYIVVDATAGELERGSLEPLFINPVSRWEFLVGKFLAAFTFSGIGLGVAMVGFWLIPRFVSTEALGIRIDLNAFVLLRIFLLVLPLTALATAIGMIVSTLSKGFKEAQTMLSFLMIMPVVPGLLLTLAPFKTKAWMMLVPILSEQILINELIRGDTVKVPFVAICVVATTVAACVGLFVATRLYSGERVFASR
jgi:sodium transport system permease protein